MWHVALNEWCRLRAGLAFWLLLALVQLIIAWLAFTQLEAFAEIAPRLKAAAATLGATDLVVMPTFNSLLLVLLIVAPLLAMGSLAGEIHDGRMPLWRSSPLSSRNIVLGKVLGLWIALLPIVLSASLTLAALGLGIALDLPRFALAVGTMLLLSVWLSTIAVLVSSLFDHPATALAASFGVFGGLWLLDSFSAAGGVLHGWALLPHIEPALRGLLRSEDLVYFVTTGGAAVLFAVQRVDRQRGLA